MNRAERLSRTAAVHHNSVREAVRRYRTMTYVNVQEPRRVVYAFQYGSVWRIHMHPVKNAEKTSYSGVK